MTILHDKFPVKHMAIAAAAAVIISGCTSEQQDRSSSPLPTNTAEELTDIVSEFDSTREQNLLQSNWEYTKGIDQQANSLKINHIGEAVLLHPDDRNNPDVPEYIPNSPVNIYGAHLEMTGGSDMGIVAELSAIAGSATLSFHSKPPVRYDERIARHPGLDVTIKDGMAAVNVYDRVTPVGNSEIKPITAELELGSAADTAAITVAQKDDVLIVGVNDQTVAFDTNPFTGQVWLGADTVGSFSIDQFKAYPVGDTAVSMVDTSQTTLTDTRPPLEGLADQAAKNGHENMEFGTAVELGELLSNPKYAEFVIQNFNYIETEIAAKFQALQPEEGNFQFAELDAFINFANKYGLEVHGHALVFNEAYPQWLYDKLETSTPDEARAIMRTHIQTVMERYNGQSGHGLIKNWDVVNEPFDPDEWGELNQDNIWYKAIGESYIADAIKHARAANPEALVGINDWAMETDDDRWEGMLALLERLEEAGAKPDYVGFQWHIDEETLADEDAMNRLREGLMVERYQQLADMGISSRISEISVAVPENGDVELQTEVYSLAVQDCLTASRCMGVNFWGATNSELSYAYFTGDILSQDPGNDAPTIQKPDGTIVYRPAWYAILDTISR